MCGTPGGHVLVGFQVARHVTFSGTVEACLATAGPATVARKAHTHITPAASFMGRDYPIPLGEGQHGQPPWRADCWPYRVRLCSRGRFTSVPARSPRVPSGR